MTLILLTVPPSGWTEGLPFDVPSVYNYLCPAGDTVA